ncbi:DUF6940 family protein [Gracilimonas mengyeensis]|uniref:Uncharacterized protein n=1 Tax=Gracilimonas mengyeensis TaxID=1302730 RepID=A0A521FDL7_9BACT|nr:hypothetical protein [Gracilimonas mengyeensis]SMO94094.1 hypothetical protein SAMN06265219_11743 [Gracilimonas mengyeensis]
MWGVKKLEKDSEHLKFKIQEDGQTISNKQCLKLLKGKPAFVEWYNGFLADCPFEAFFWENKPMTQHNLTEDYECNLVESDLLARVSPDTQTFRSHFRENKNAVSFTNLGGDAQLVAPCPVSAHSDYTQIGNFVRKAPEEQILEFWQLVGKEMEAHISDNPKWLSTSGLGVYWLHVRIDSTPKYYQTKEYKVVSG